MGEGNNSSTKSLLSSFESADNLDPSVRKVIQSLQDAVVNLQEEVQDLIKGGTPEQATNQVPKDQLSIEAGQGIKVISMCNRRIICNTQKSAAPVTGISFKEFSVVAEFGDYLECQTIVSSGDPVTVYVAKPYFFRKSVFDGKTINGITYTYSLSSGTIHGDRIASNESYSETQKLTPAYFSYTSETYERILAASYATGIQTDISETGQAEATNIVWIDMNIAGRAWAVDISLQTEIQGS